MSAPVIKAGVAGWPVSHSLSPLMMQAWLKDAAIPGAYDRLPIEPDHFSEKVRALAGQGYAGINVTLPHKEAALALADTASEAARAVGAANVLVFREGSIHADNTDITGIRIALETGGWHKEGEGPAVLIGAGGAARAALHVLKKSRCPVRIVNRSTDRAKALASSFGVEAGIHGPDDAKAALAGAGLVINATSLGMTGQPDLDLPLEGVRADALVFDMVYVPRETGLLAAAKARGLKTADGLSMLIGQARPAFEHFYGAEPPRGTPVRTLLEVALDGR